MHINFNICSNVLSKVTSLLQNLNLCIFLHKRYLICYHRNQVWLNVVKVVVRIKWEGVSNYAIVILPLYIYIIIIDFDRRVILAQVKLQLQNIYILLH